MTDYQPIEFQVEFTAMWKEPSARINVRPRSPQAPLNARTVAYVIEVRRWLTQEFYPLLAETNAAALRASADDLEAMTRGKLLKAARGDIRVGFPITEESALTTPVRLTDPR